MTDNNGVIDQIYAGLNSVLGGTNPNQFLTMTVPGTMLNQSDFAYDTTATKPALVAEAESRLVDQMFDVAQVTGSGNGQHVSSQFLQALSVLVPKFNPVMPAMKNRLREFVNSPAPQNSTVEGEPFSGTLRELYFALYESWLRTKSEWDREVIGQKARLGAEAFTEWYEGVAEGRLALIDAAEGRLVSVFSPSDMNAILGALASGPGGDISAAATQTLDVRLLSPSGGYVYPVDLSPSDWFLSLASDQNPTDLLKDPQFIALTLRARQQALQATISQVQALISQVPTPVPWPRRQAPEHGPDRVHGCAERADRPVRRQHRHRRPDVPGRLQPGRRRGRCGRRTQRGGRVRQRCQRRQPGGHPGDQDRGKPPVAGGLPEAAARAAGPRHRAVNPDRQRPEPVDGRHEPGLRTGSGVR